MNQTVKNITEENTAEEVADSQINQSIPIQLRLQIGELQLPFSKLAEFVPGHVVALNKPLDQELVTIYANGAAVAVGELVCIDTMVGVQIRRMLNGHGTR